MEPRSQRDAADVFATKIDSVTKGSAIRENFERIQFNISSCDFLRLGV